MSTKKVTVDNLANEIVRIFDDYIDEIDEVVEEETDSVSKEAKQELVRVSPKETKKYSKGWANVQGYKIKHYFSKRIYNRTHYRLTHLLEFDHATKNGGTVKGQAHVRPTEQKYKQILVGNIERRIKRWH